MEQGLLVKTVTFSYSHLLKMTLGGARVAGGMSGKDCHIQSQPSTEVQPGWSNGCQRDVW